MQYKKIKAYTRLYRVCPKMYPRLLNKISPKVLLNNIADPPKRKKCLTDDEFLSLMTGYVDIEEKIDGGVVGLAWQDDHHLAIGKHSMIPNTEQGKKFFGLNNWIYEHYEQLAKIPLNWIVYGEWMRASHNIFYDKLPDYFIAFDVWNGKQYLNRELRSTFLYNLEFAEVPLLYRGSNLNLSDVLKIAEGLNNIKNISRCSSTETIEGLVIKNDNELRGKYVRREFMNSIEEHWLKSPLIENKLFQHIETK